MTVIAANTLMVRFIILCEFRGGGEFKGIKLEGNVLAANSNTADLLNG